MWQPSTSRRQSWTESLLLRKKVPDTIHSTSADRSMGLYSVSLLRQPMKQWRKPNIHQQQATRFTRPISPACDRYVQYLLMGPTERSLTDIGGGYNLEVTGSPHTHSLTLSICCLSFPLVALPGLHLTKLQQLNQSVKF
jgi:hypothetical protein